MNLLVYQFHDHTDDIQDNTELDFDIRAIIDSNESSTKEYGKFFSQI